MSTEVLAVGAVLAGGWFAATAYTSLSSNAQLHWWTLSALAAGTGLVLMQGLAFGRPLTTGHVALALAAGVLAVWAHLAGNAIGAYAAALGAATVLVWPTGADAEPGALPQVWALVDRTRGDPLAPFAMDRQKRYLFAPGNAAAVAYRVRAGFGVVGGDPIGDPSAYRDVVVAFLTLCRAQGWRPLILAASPRCAALWRYQEPGFWAVPIGRDIVVDVTTFSLDGRSKRNLRQAVNRTHNAGITTAVIAESDVDPGLRAELMDVARVSKNSIDTTRGFSMMLDGTLTGRYPGTLLIVARDRAGVVQAFHRYVTAGGGSEVSLDLPWRRPGAPNGTDERLTVDMISWAKHHGGQRLSLAFAPFPGVFAEGRAGPATRVVRMLLHAMDGLIKLESLYRYLSKYDALGQRRYVLLERIDLLPALAVLLTLEFSPHQVDRVSAPPVRANPLDRASRSMKGV